MQKKIYKNNRNSRHKILYLKKKNNNIQKKTQLISINTI